MEGYLEIRTRKLLQSNKKFWFVLGQEKLEYYSDREDASANLEPLGHITMSDVLDVRVAHDQRNTLTLVRRGEENLRLKVRGGQAHNWLGNIRERIFFAREGDIPVLRKKKKRAIRSFSRTYEDIDLLASHTQNRCSRSTNDLSQLFSARSVAQDSPGDSSSDAPHDSLTLDHLSLTSSFRSRNTSVSSSSLFSGSSVSSRGSDGNYRRKPRIPVSGFTGRAFLANEKEMVEKAEIIANEDFEYIVQAERDGTLNSDVTDGDIINVAVGIKVALTDQEKENNKEVNSKNVRFNSEEDIHMVEEETRCSKKNKKKKKSSDKDDKENKKKPDEAQNTRQRTASFVWGRITLGKSKTSQSSEMKDQQLDTAGHENINGVKNSMSENKNLSEETSTRSNHSIIEASESGIKCDKVEKDNKSDVFCEGVMNTNNAEIFEKESTGNDYENKKNDDEELIKLRCPLERPKSSPSLAKPETRHEATVNDASDKSGHLRRYRVTSVSSRNSRDSLDSITSSGMKDRIFHWKRSSSRSPKSVTISNPLKIENPQKETASSDMNSQIDKIANDRLEAVFKHKQNSIEEERRDPSKVPKKPLTFHIRQLKMLLAGDINPPPGQDDISEVQLRLDSLRVMQSLNCVTCESDSTVECDSTVPDSTVPGVYDVPRPLQIA